MKYKFFYYKGRGFILILNICNRFSAGHVFQFLVCVDLFNTLGVFGNPCRGATVIREIHFL